MRNWIVAFLDNVMLVSRPTWLGNDVTTRHGRKLLAIAGIVVCITTALIFFRSAPVNRIPGWVGTASSTNSEVNEALPKAKLPEFYNWRTRSALKPVHRDDVDSMSAEELCASHPTHLLNDIQPVLRTGHGVLDMRVSPQLQSVSACLSNLLIFSDLDEVYQGHDIIDVIADMPENYIGPPDPPLNKEGKVTPDQLLLYRNMQELAAKGSLAELNTTSREAWKIDKFKFLNGISRAWRMRPERRWYVFYEDDTYVVWDNVFRLLEHFDPDVPLYFGSPSPGRNETWFAYGGSGYVLSREAMRRLTADDWDRETGEYLGTKLTERLWDIVWSDCCGDSIVGWSLYLQDVILSGLWPMFTPHRPDRVPYTERQWCQPIVSMHKPTTEDLVDLWRWEWKHRQPRRPLTYRDLATTYYNITTLTIKDDWDNTGRDAFKPLFPSNFYTTNPHDSFSACGSACAAHPNCFQYNYHLRQCNFVRAIVYGYARDPEIGKKPTEEQLATEWSEEDLRFRAGWMTEKVRKWVEERRCEEVRWVRPSVERIF